VCYGANWRLICYKPVPMSYRYTIIDVEEFNHAEESFKSLTLFQPIASQAAARCSEVSAQLGGSHSTEASITLGYDLRVDHTYDAPNQQVTFG